MTKSKNKKNLFMSRGKDFFTQELILMCVGDGLTPSTELTSPHFTVLVQPLEILGQMREQKMGRKSKGGYQADGTWKNLSKKEQQALRDACEKLGMGFETVARIKDLSCGIIGPV